MYNRRTVESTFGVAGCVLIGTRERAVIAGPAFRDTARAIWNRRGLVGADGGAVFDGISVEGTRSGRIDGERVIALRRAARPDRGTVVRRSCERADGCRTRLVGRHVVDVCDVEGCVAVGRRPVQCCRVAVWERVCHGGDRAGPRKGIRARNCSVLAAFQLYAQTGKKARSRTTTATHPLAGTEQIGCWWWRDCCDVCCYDSRDRNSRCDRDVPSALIIE